MEVIEIKNIAKRKGDKGRDSVFDQLDPEILDKIDAFILQSTMKRTQLARAITAKFNVKIARHHLLYREKMLREKYKEELEKAKSRLSEDEEGKSQYYYGMVRSTNQGEEIKDKGLDSLTILKDKLVDIAELDIKDAKEKEVIEKLKKNLNSAFRYASELFEQAPYLSYLNFIINVMQIRIAKRFELENQLNIIMKDNSVDIKLMVEVIEKAIQLQQSLGLLNKVDNQNNYIQNNIYNNTPQTASSQIDGYVKLYRERKESASRVN